MAAQRKSVELCVPSRRVECMRCPSRAWSSSFGFWFHLIPIRFFFIETLNNARRWITDVIILVPTISVLITSRFPSFEWINLPCLLHLSYLLLRICFVFALEIWTADAKREHLTDCSDSRLASVRCFWFAVICAAINFLLYKIYD